MTGRVIARRTPDSSRNFGRRDWIAVVKRVAVEAKRDHLTLLSGGIAFYAFVSIFPAVIAALAIYSLVADPVEVENQINTFAAALPGSVDQMGSPPQIIADWLNEAATQDSGALTLGLTLSIGGALWTASLGVAGIMDGINAAYETFDNRGFLRKRGLALVLTLGAVVFVVVSIALIAVVPVALDFVGLEEESKSLIRVTRWPLLAVGVMAALAVLYHVAPDRDMPRFSFGSWGALVATALWLIGSGGFSIYVANFGGGTSYEATYGALAGVVVMLFWLFLSALAILLGAEIDAEIERQKRIRAADTGGLSIERRDPLLMETRV